MERGTTSGLVPRRYRGGNVGAPHGERQTRSDSRSARVVETPQAGEAAVLEEATQSIQTGDK